MKQLLIAVILCSLTITSAYAGGTTGKKDLPKEKDINISIHIDKDGGVQINGKGISGEEIEKWVNDRLKNITVNIDDESEDEAPEAPATGKKEKIRTLSITIKEK